MPDAAPVNEPAPAAPAVADSTPPITNIVADAAPAPADPAAAAPAATDKPAEPAPPAEPAKPVEYTDFKIPDGVTLDAKLLSDAKADFAKANLTQDQAQAFIDKHVSAVKASVDANIAAFTKLQSDWQTEIKADPEMGGANFESKTVPAIAKAISTFGGDVAAQKAFREAVSLTGIGNNPHYVRFMARLGASLMEGSPTSGKPPAGKAAQRDFDSLASNLYPNQGSPS